MMDHGGAVHPRPQMTRAAWTDLSGVWDFAYDDAKRGLIEGWHIRPDAFTRRIVVPFPPESSASGIGERGFHPIVWYRRTFTRPSSGQGERVLLHCGAVDYRAQVWVNGQLVATHEGGHTPFEADITAALHDDGEQVVVIRAEDLPDDLAQPRGKQDWEDPRFLYWCDRLGLLVWGEIANAYVFSPEAARRLMNEWTEAVTRDYSHPSIVAWVPLNESWGVNNLARDPAQQHYVQALYHLTKALDPTRPVIGNDGWEFLVGDVLGIHDYTFDGATLRQRYGSAEAVERTIREVQPGSRCITLPGHQRGDQPIMITEFGGISERTDPETEWFGYGTVGDRESFLTKYRELVDAILDSPVIAGFCYTQLTDTEQETNGLLTADRAHKLDPAAVRAITQRPSAAVPTEIIAVMQQAHSTTSAADAAVGASEHG